MRWSPLVIALLGCSSELEHDSRWSGQVVIGEDDRVEPFTLPEDISAAASSAAALVYGHKLSWSADGGVEMHAGSLGESLGLCADEAFASQPALSFCSGALVDDNLVLTSGHCLAQDPEAFCRQTLIVFGYAYAAEDQPLELDGEEVFACRRVLTWHAGEIDYAVIELDRATSRRPVTLANHRAALGDTVTVASYPSGVPLKCETGAPVETAETDAPSFVAATDTFGGSSGGPVFDEALDWVGVVKSGAPDWVSAHDCTRAVRSDTSREVHQHAGSIVEAVCTAGLPSARLCGATEQCGDGRCGADETRASCSEDCQAVVCGDTVCELVERSSCAEDCSRFARVPWDWPEAPEKYLQWYPPETSAEPASGCHISRPRQQNHLTLGWLLLLAIAALRRRVSDVPIDSST